MPPNARVAGLGGSPTFADARGNGEVAPKGGRSLGERAEVQPYKLTFTRRRG
jgi:hypothetical protein